MLFFRAVSALLLCAFLLSACSEAPTEPPPFGMSADVLTDGTVTSTMTMVTADGERPIGTAHQGVERGEIDGREVIHLTLVQELSRGVMRDSLVIDAASLQPLEYFNDMPGLQSIHTVYGPGGSVTVDLERGAMTNHVDTVLIDPHLDAASFTSILPMLPLAVGLDTEYPVFHYENGVLSYRVQVPGTETVATCRGQEDSWIVDVTTALNTTRHWISREDGHLVQVLVDLGGGNRFEQTLVCG